MSWPKRKFVGVLPYSYGPYYDEFMKTWHRDDRAELLFLDNTGIDNLGVAESWNWGIDHMRKCQADWLIIISATMRFGKDGIKQMYEQIDKHDYANIIHFAKSDVPEQNYAGADSPPYDSGVFYWHLTAVNKRVFDKIGYFDPNFYPIYYEDTDFDIRFRKAFDDPQRLILPIDATSEGVGHAVKLGGVKAPAEPNIVYFVSKWGRSPEAPQLGEYEHPFNNENNSLAFFPPTQGRVWNE